MLSTAADVLSLAQAAPWLAVGVLALVAAAWVYRQSRRAVREVRDEAARSAASQGKRLGELEKAVGLLDLRRRQTEAALLDEDVELPYWPPDGPQQPRRRRDVDELGPETMQRRVPIPPLDLPDRYSTRR
jgi:hypothetical protein